MNLHTVTARHVHDLLVAAGIPQVSPVPVPAVPLTSTAVVVGVPRLPEQAVSTGCTPAEMLADVTVVASGITRAAVEALYARADEVVTALLADGAWNVSTVPTSWQGQEMQPVPAITVTASVGYQEE